MTKPISKRSFRKPDARYAPVDLVVCEGESERDYLSELARSWRIHVHICKGDGTDPKSIVNTAKRKLKEDGVKYDNFFCVFDRDKNLSDYLEAVELCRAKKFIPIVSNPCFELWLLLHYEEIISPLHRTEVIKRLKTHIRGYDKGKTGVFEITREYLNIAIERAEKLIKADDKNIYTEVVHLVRILKENKLNFLWNAFL